MPASTADKMAEALIVLVRIEERTSTLFKRLDASDARMNGISTRLTDLEKTSDRRRDVRSGRSAILDCRHRGRRHWRLVGTERVI